MANGNKRRNTFWDSPIVRKSQKLFHDRYSTPTGYNASRIFQDGQSIYNTGRNMFGGSRNSSTRSPRVRLTIPPLTPRIRHRGDTRAKKGYGAQTSKSAGKLRTRRKPRKPKGWQAGKGLTQTWESGGSIGARNCLYVGHITGPKDRLYEQAFKSILKLLLIKMNIRIRDFAAPLSEVGFVTGDDFQFRYASTSQTTGVTVINYTVAGGETFNAIANGMYVEWLDANFTDIVPKSFGFIPGTSAGHPVASIALEELMLHFDIKSSLKIQNRSVNITSEPGVEYEADTVDNVPLYGKSIGGTGTGVLARFPNATVPANVVGQADNGLITQVTLDEDQEEPLSGYFFPKSTQQGKIHLDPGQIKTSVITTKRNISLKYLFRLFSTSTYNQPLTSFGKYRFFQIEKMIDTGVDINMSVAYEINTSMSCFATTKYNWTTAPIYSKIPAIE